MSTSNGDPKGECASLEKGAIRFYDNYVPTLPVGDYLINVTQRINPRNTKIDECHAASQVFSVQGPRYALPSEDIFSIFPPNNAVGIFDQFLPHVVLSKRELPWERNVFGDDDPARQRPWMALLLFVEGEKIDGADALLAPHLPAWTPNRTMTAIIPAADFHHHPSGDGTLWPALESEWYESEQFLNETLSTIIDISPQAFAKAIPGMADLPYLAHVRQVDPTAKESSVLKISRKGWYSIVVGNRLADTPPPGTKEPGKRNILHLVSLEGFQEYVSGRKAIPTGTARVRMISLKSWTFTCLPQMGESFAQSMNDLLKDANGNPKRTDFRLPIPAPRDPSEEEAYAYRTIRNGYVPLRYQTRLGEQTYAWYRGPLSPIPIKNFVSTKQRASGDPVTWKQFDTASAAVIYDRNYGIFDPSYGVAWETGRMMALADPYFGPKLLEWQQKGHYLVDMIMERQHQVKALKSRRFLMANAETPQDLVDLTAPYAVTDDLMVELITGFARRIGPRLYGTAPAAAPTASAAPPTAPHPIPFADQHSPAPSPDDIAVLLGDRPLRANAALLGEPRLTVREAVRTEGSRELEEIVQWLSRLYLLEGVPFESLVPNSDLLPPNSVRFFHLDSNWLDILVEGALSIGIESSRDIFYQKLMSDLVEKQTADTARKERRLLLGEYASAPNAQPFDQETLTGLLLRSSVVSGWPGLEIHAYTRTRPGSAEPDIESHIDLLRMERLSDDVMLCLWPAVPAVVTIDEPHEGVAFGFEDPPTAEGNGYYLYLRSLDPNSYGKPLAGGAQAIDAARGIIGPDRRIRIAGGGGLLEAIRGKLPGSPAINVRDFAIQMIKVPEQAIFAAPPAIAEEKQ